MDSLDITVHQAVRHLQSVAHKDNKPDQRNRFINAVYRFLYNSAYTIVKDQQTTHYVDDLVSDVMYNFLRIADKEERYNTTGQLKPYLYAMIGNRHKSIYAKEQRRKHFRPLEGQPDLLKEVFAKTDASANPESMINHDYLLEQVNKLPPLFLTPFKLGLAGYNNKEIAKKIDIPVGTAKTRKFYAQKKLKKSLGQDTSYQ